MKAEVKELSHMSLCQRLKWSKANGLTSAYLTSAYLTSAYLTPAYLTPAYLTPTLNSKTK